MKLSNSTVELLKNFSTINSGIFFNKGNKISTISANKNILAVADIEEDMPQEFGIYDLNNFLQILSLDKNGVDLDFDSHHVTMKMLDGRSKIKYRFSAKEMIIVPPDKKLVLPSKECEVKLDENDLQWILKTSSVLQSPNIAFESDGDDIFITSLDSVDDSKNTNSLKIAPGNGRKYKFLFKTENLKMLLGTYDVAISKQGFAEFNSKDRVLKYSIALELKGSTYE